MYILVFIFFIFANCQQNKYEKILNEKEKGSSMSIRNYSRQSYDEKGLIEWNMNAKEAFIYIKESVQTKTVMYQINFEQFENKIVSVKLLSDRAEIDDESKKIQLWDHIFFKTSEGRILRTSYLIFDTENKLLTTDAPVEIISMGTRINGVGLIAEQDLKKFTIIKPKAVTTSSENPF